MVQHIPPSPPSAAQPAERLNHQRLELLQRLENGLELPMLVLGFVWFVLLVVEMLWGLSRGLETLSIAIWIVFIVDFLLKLVLAPHKLRYILTHWLTVLALLLPALRLFRIFRTIRLLQMSRATGGMRLVRVVSTLNRGMKALGTTMGRRGFGYVMGLTVLVSCGGAAGMYAFEHDVPHGLTTYSNALWWTLMLLTSIGSEYWPQTPEGRMLCFLLAVYGFCVFGYVTATLATFFVGRDAEDETAELVGAADFARLENEMAELRQEVRQLIQRLDSRESN